MDTPKSKVNSEKKLIVGGAEIFEQIKMKNQILNPIKRIFLPLIKTKLRE
jgi:hypothetical protein